MLDLVLLPDDYAVCRLPAGSALPPACGRARASSPSPGRRTRPRSSAPAGRPRPTAIVNTPWRCLRVNGPVNLALTGILASLVNPLAEARVNIFAFSTYDTDYVLVPAVRLEEALSALAAAGHRVTTPADGSLETVGRPRPDPSARRLWPCRSGTSTSGRRGPSPSRRCVRWRCRPGPPCRRAGACPRPWRRCGPARPTPPWYRWRTRSAGPRASRWTSWPVRRRSSSPGRSCSRSTSCWPPGRGPQLDSLTAIAAHPNAARQCRGWLRAHAPDAVVVDALSNGAAAAGVASGEYRGRHLRPDRRAAAPAGAARRVHRRPQGRHDPVRPGRPARPARRRRPATT